MSWIQKVLEHSTKAGRITALIMVLMIAGSLSIMQCLEDPTEIDKTIDGWMDLVIMVFAFYFAMGGKGNDKS